MKYHVWTIGCQMNKADSERMAAALEELGLEPIAEIERADVIVLNSCCVRQSAEERVWSKLGSLKPLKRKHPQKIIALMGCVVGPDISDLRRRWPDVDVFLRPSAVEPLVEIVRDRLPSKSPEPLAKAHLAPLPLPWAPEQCPEASLQYPTVSRATPSAVGRPTRWVAVIYGCDKFCTYCIVPYRRGRERSRPPAEIIDEVKKMVAERAREVTLLGQNVDSYGHDLPGKTDLADLLANLNGIEGLWRIRFLTSHPKDMTAKLIQAMAILPKVCEHLNLPVQSGDDRILRAMGRGYTVAMYRELVARIGEAIPGISLSTDVIVGFPTESEEEFQNTYNLLQELRFDVVHVAMYSPRPGTKAAKMPDDVPKVVKKARLAAVEELQERIAAERNAALLGQVVEVLVEGREKGKWQGRTRTNKLVFFQDERDWLGQMAMVRVEKTSAWSLQGSVAVNNAHPGRNG
ncbi:MAG: tRNA (N6-isopentenyl adenosine(37)-C2)-methylthiotransferase MiaB [Chloroflexi bacterium]|nr:tRNA (N6-isopentenyl adenosine(37)-C2)-methylthiotransferase MiaB [Chloroflexota bacterium]MCL5074390.1 tRNA (N6-isopentenyl adenosine(37)-C2)-methylthiotransferase MiaB [Chloroflexota bacterium]